METKFHAKSLLLLGLFSTSQRLTEHAVGTLQLFRVNVSLVRRCSSTGSVLVEDNRRIGAFVRNDGLKSNSSDTQIKTCYMIF